MAGSVDVAPPPPPAPSRRTRWRDAVRMTYRVIRSNPTGRITLRLMVAVLGALVVAAGIVLIPLPGPGWALVIIGLSIWAVEFVWARHLLGYTRQQLSRWIRWTRGQPWPMRLLVGGVGLVFVGAVALLSLKYSFGIDLWADLWQYVTTH